MKSNIDTIIEHIRRIFPYPIDRMYTHQGDDFLVVEVNDTWMFRSPLHASAREVFQYEKLFLARFAPHSPVAVPVFQYQHDHVVGYQKLQGIFLTPQVFASLHRDTQHRLIRQMGAFLSVMHAFPVAEARQIGLKENWGGWYQHAAGLVHEQVMPFLSTTSRHTVATFLKHFLALEYSPVVVHGDFYPRDCVLFNKERQMISGVIDFGDITLDDPAGDFTNLLEDLGIEILHEVLSSYTGERDATFVERIHMHRYAKALFHVPYVLEYGFPERFHQCMTKIEGLFQHEDFPVSCG